MQKNPILESWKNIAVYLSFWIIIITLNYLLLVFHFRLTFKAAALDSAVFNILLCGLGLSFWYTASYMPIEQSRLSGIMSKHILAGIVVSALWLSAGYFIITGIFGYNTDFNSFFNLTLAWRFVIGVLFYYLTISFYYIIIYNRNLHEKISSEMELKNLITETELRSLKFQINPHFIFNSLNSMSALTTISPERAREMILKLADFLRFTLATNNKQTNSVSEELRNIKLYLDIEKIRFEDKFEYAELINPECSNFQIPTMILQPLFENAIKHAVYESLEKVTLKLSCKKMNNYMEILLENNYEPGAENKKGTGTGLKNIKKRLELIYNQDNLLSVEKNGNIFGVRIYIPV
jgi:two-component system LytT family sensor kinase